MKIKTPPTGYEFAAAPVRAVEDTKMQRRGRCRDEHGGKRDQRGDEKRPSLFTDWLLDSVDALGPFASRCHNAGSNSGILRLKSK